MSDPHSQLFERMFNERSRRVDRLIDDLNEEARESSSLIAENKDLKDIAASFILRNKSLLSTLKFIEEKWNIKGLEEQAKKEAEDFTQKAWSNEIPEEKKSAKKRVENVLEKYSNKNKSSVKTIK